MLAIIILILKENFINKNKIKNMRFFENKLK